MYILGITKKLLLVVNIAYEGYIVTFEWMHCQIVNTTHPTKVITRRKQDSTNRLYRLESNCYEPCIYLVAKNYLIFL